MKMDRINCRGKCYSHLQYFSSGRSIYLGDDVTFDSNIGKETKAKLEEPETDWDDEIAEPAGESQHEEEVQLCPGADEPECHAGNFVEEENAEPGEAEDPLKGLEEIYDDSLH